MKKFFSVIKWLLAILGLGMVGASRFVGVSNTVGQIGAWMMAVTFVFSLFNVWGWMEEKCSHN